MKDHTCNKRAKLDLREHLDGGIMGIDESSAHDFMATRGLADLEEELLTQIATHLVEARNLCRFGAAAQTFRRLILSDGAAAADVWTPALQRMGCHGLPLPPSAQVCRNISCISSTAWSPLHLRCAEPQDIYKQRLRGLTGAACCHLDSALLLFGGTLNGNTGPVFGDLLHLHFDSTAGELHVQYAHAVDDADDEDSLGMGLPGGRRGHTMTESTFADGTSTAVLLGGWGYEEHSMDPLFLTSRPSDCAGAVHGRLYSWGRRAIAGQPPSPRAFHSATEVAPGRLVVYGGLGPGCCRTDVWVLDLHALQWSQPTVAGSPRCRGGRAGHGAVFFPLLDGRGGGELLLLSGASRSERGDAHQGSVDVLQVSTQSSDSGGDRGGEVGGGGGGLRLRWSEEEEWGRVQLPHVRSAAYAVIGRTVLAWSGVSEHHEPMASMHAVSVDRRTSRAVAVTSGGGASEGSGGGLGGAEGPAPRGGAVCVGAVRGGHSALVLCGSDHSGTADMLTPYVLSVPLAD